MSKRSTEETDTIEFSFDNSNEQLRKKIKLLNDKIIERIKEIDEEIDINKHEVHKFLLIFHSLFEIVTSGETFEETGGIFNDTILAVCNIIAGLLRNNIDNLKLPAAQLRVQTEEANGPSGEGRKKQRQDSSEE